MAKKAMASHRFLLCSQKLPLMLYLLRKLLRTCAEKKEGVSYMEKLKIVIKKYWKIYLAALVISVICDLIGTLKLNIGIGTLTLFPMVFAVIFGGLLGPDIFKLFKSNECKIGGSLVLRALKNFHFFLSGSFSFILFSNLYLGKS